MQYDNEKRFVLFPKNNANPKAQTILEPSPLLVRNGSFPLGTSKAKTEVVSSLDL